MTEELADPELESDLEALYRLVPGEFTAARNNLVKRLRKQKHRDDAARIAKLSKPTAAAWALNQVAHARPDLIDSLLRHGEQLRQIQDRVMRGEAEAPLLLLASQERRAAVRALVQAIGDTLGAGEARRNDEWVRTLEAASVDDRLATLLKQGRFSSVVFEGVGFDGLLVGADPVRRHLTIVPPRPEEGVLSATGGEAEHEAADKGAAERAEAERAEAERAEAERAEAERARTRPIELAQAAEANARESEAAAATDVALAREARAATERTVAEAEAVLAALRADLDAARETEQTADRRHAYAATALESASAAVTVAISVDETATDPIAPSQ